MNKKLNDFIESIYRLVVMYFATLIPAKSVYVFFSHKLK